MSDVVVLENVVDGEWRRRLRVMAARAEALDEFLAGSEEGQGIALPLQAIAVPQRAAVRRFQDDIRLFHLEASWQAREVIRLSGVTPGSLWTVVAWWVGGEKLSKAILEAGAVFALGTGRDPVAAFVRRLPKGVEEFVEVWGVGLVQADWVLEGFVVVTGAGMWQGLPMMTPPQPSPNERAPFGEGVGQKDSMEA